jgi:Type II CAAX prenyl endopeptidase Rce1-like
LGARRERGPDRPGPAGRASGSGAEQLRCEAAADVGAGRDGAAAGRRLPAHRHRRVRRGIGWTGFLQDRWQDRYSPAQAQRAVALPWAVWHLPDFFAEEGVGIEQIATAPIFFVFEFVSLFFARVLIVWLYAMTGRSVLLVAIFHASFDASISELSSDIIPGSDAARLAIFTGVIVLAAVVLILATRGQFAHRRGEGAGSRAVAISH